MTDYILRKRIENISLDRWENEGGKAFPEQTDRSERSSSGKQMSANNKFGDYAGRESGRGLLQPR